MSTTPHLWELRAQLNEEISTMMPTWARHRSFLHSLRSFRSLAVVAVIAAAFVLVGNAAWTADRKVSKGQSRVQGAVRLFKTVPIPVSSFNTTAGALYSFDISWVDQTTGTYYLADRSNRAVDSLNAETIVTQIFPNSGHGPFAGFVPCVLQPAGANDCAGPNGVVAAFPWLFVTDAPSRVLSFDLRTSPPTTVSEITTLAGEPTRADESAYDPEDGLLLVINNASSPPFGTLIKVDQASGVLSFVKRIVFDVPNTGVDATDGAEQPVWDPVSHKFYLSIPEISGDGSTNLHGAVLRISTA